MDPTTQTQDPPANPATPPVTPLVTPPVQGSGQITEEQRLEAQPTAHSFLNHAQTFDGHKTFFGELSLRKGLAQLFN